MGNVRHGALKWPLLVMISRCSHARWSVDGGAAYRNAHHSFASCSRSRSRVASNVAMRRTAWMLTELGPGRIQVGMALPLVGRGACRQRYGQNLEPTSYVRC